MNLIVIVVIVVPIAFVGNCYFICYTWKYSQTIWIKINRVPMYVSKGNVEWLKPLFDLTMLT